jgi:uncharacterized protein
MIIKSKFKPAWWLKNEHAQTVYPTLAHRSKAPITKQERIELPDGDFIDLSWATDELPTSSPLIVLLHGLGGSVRSVYVSGLLRAMNQCGYRGVLMHFRGASHEPNRLPRTYHCGDTGDFSYLLRLLNRREPDTSKAAIGISLGGNVLLKWLGEEKEQSLIKAAVAVSVPFQLESVANRMTRGFSRIYQAHLLRRLRQMHLKKIEHHGRQSLGLQHDLKSLNSFWLFDEHVTAPLNGFKHAQDYYHQASSKQFLKQISTPTLIIQALDDPFMTPDIFPTEADLSEKVTLELSQCGGHVGFVAGNIPGKPVYWLEERIPAFIKSVLET